MFKEMDEIVDLMDEAIEKLNLIGSEQRMRNQNAIRTSFDYPPIPIRDYDWSAIRYDYDSGGLIGYGKTEQEAIDNLKKQENELL